MFWTSVLPVTIFMLANTLCVSESAATGGRQRLQTEALGGSRIVKRVGSSSISLQPDYSPMSSSSSASSVESQVPDWINSRTPHSKNEMVNESDDDDMDEGDDEVSEGTALGGDNQDWEEAPLPNLGRLRFRYNDNEQNEPLVVQQPLFYRDRMVLSSPPEMVELPQSYSNMMAGSGAARRFHYNPLSVGVVQRLRPLPLHMKNQVAASQQPTQQVMWSPAKSNYRVPAEGFIRANGFDKRSPRCIAKCMQQGMVHPLQCHSLC